MQYPDLFKVFEETMDSFKGLLIIDREGKIVSITRNYAEFLGFNDPADVLGLDVEEVIPNTRMMDVIQTGVPDLADVWNIHGETLIINRMPLKIGGEIVGALAFAVFQDQQEALEFALRFARNGASPSGPDARQSWKAKYSVKSIIGVSQAVNSIKRQIRMVADAECPVLINGETGTGKELVAHALHNESRRKDQPFVRVNCASIPEALWESELFGYEEGAFTGARRGGKLGKFEIADRGTIFLDEIGEMPLAAQAKLLRVLQEMEIERVGSEKLRRVDVRLLAATNRDLRAFVKAKTFREDLFYRLAVFEINMTPLRERREDISLLARHITQKIAFHQGFEIKGLDESALRILQQYEWPGNVRELTNTLERACLIKRAGTLDLDTLKAVKPEIADIIVPVEDRIDVRFHLKRILRQSERTAIIEALLTAGGSRTVAAESLGIHRTSLYQKMRELDIDLADVDEIIHRNELNVD
ncbi:MAG: sigma-54 interaction domain-containing protein [Deltaproteobacteria bacterium]